MIEGSNTKTDAYISLRKQHISEQKDLELKSRRSSKGRYGNNVKNESQIVL
jgi:hypothetical protein